MAQYIDKSAVVAEIESKKKYAQSLGDNAINGSMQQFYDGMKQGCIDILSFLDTLEVKEVDVHLEDPLISPELLTASAAYAREQLANPDYPTYNDEYELLCAFEAGAKWQKEVKLSDIKKAVTGKLFQFSMDNVEAWGDEPNGKTIKLKGRVTFQVNNPESIIDALIAFKNDN